MGERIGVQISIEDGTSQEMKTVANAVAVLTKNVKSLRQELGSMQVSTGSTGKSMKALGGNVDDLRSKLDSLETRKTILNIDTQEALKALADANEAYKNAQRDFEEADFFQSSGNFNAAHNNLINSYNALQNASIGYRAMKSELEGVSKSAKETTNQLHQVEAEKSKSQNRVSGSSVASEILMKMGGDIATKWANHIVESSLGSNAGTLFEGGLSGAITGAELGKMLGPIGAAWGAGIGALVGTVDSALTISKEQDSAFKDVVRSQYNSIKAESQQSLEAGSALAAQQEDDKLRFGRVMGSSEADAHLNWIEDTAASTPFSYTELTGLSQTMLPYKYTPEVMQERIMQIGNTGTDLGWTSLDENAVAKMLGEMDSGVKVSIAQLNALSDKGIPAIKYLAQARDVSPEAIYDMVSQGQIPGQDAATIIADRMGEAHPNAMENQAGSYRELTANLQDLQQQIEASKGEGYNEKRKEGIKAQQEWLEGESGEKMSEANRLIGEYQASLENEREAMYRESQEAALKRIEEQGLTGADAGRELEKARVEAENNYRKTEGYQLYQQTEMELVGMLQNDLADGWENFGYTMGQAFTKGLLSADYKYTSDPNYRAAGGLTREEQDALTISIHGGNQASGKKKQSTTAGAPLAMGLQYVPYDDFPALLHEGERVLTAAEARSSQYRQPSAMTIIASGGERPISLNVTGNNFSIREEADIYRIAREIAGELRRYVEVS